MNEKSGNGMKGWLVGVIVTIILALVSFACMFGSLLQASANVCEQVRQQASVLQMQQETIAKLQDQNAELCERVASLEAVVSLALSPRSQLPPGKD